MQLLPTYIKKRTNKLEIKRETERIDNMQLLPAHIFFFKEKEREMRLANNKYLILHSVLE
jgi:hypothetical protein